MIPSEEFAQKRQDAVEFIRQYIPAPLQEQLIELLRPAIVLTATRADDAQIAVGVSKFGGGPDVPEGFEWPVWNGRPLGFLAQINLEEVAPYDVEGLLPPNGLLWFFASLGEDNRVWGETGQFQGWRVLFGRGPLHRIECSANSHWISPVTVQQVDFGGDWAVPGDMPDDLFDALVSLDGDEADKWEDFQWMVAELVPHRMLTTPYAPQLSPLAVAANGSQGKSGYALYDDNASNGGWELLLQLDTGKDGFFEGEDNLGWFFFLIRREDLEKADFSRVWFNGQST